MKLALVSRTLCLVVSILTIIDHHANEIECHESLNAAQILMRASWFMLQCDVPPSNQIMWCGRCEQTRSIILLQWRHMPRSYQCNPVWIYWCESRNAAQIRVRVRARVVLDRPATINAIMFSLRNTFMQWSIFCCIWKCSRNFGADESQRDLSFDQPTIYIYAMIHFLLYLEVLAKFWSRWVLSVQSIFPCWMWSGYGICIYAMIHFVLHLEVLAKFWSRWVSSVQSIFPCWMWSVYEDINAKFWSRWVSSVQSICPC